jgi:TolB-like protein/tetratricopeptide (TPR) repeat protein
MSNAPISFGPFTLDPDRRALIRDGNSSEIGQRAFGLLQSLIQAEGKPVSKAALMEAGWSGLAVEEGNLTVQIAGLRRLLGHDAKGQDWIVTVPRFGYRLIMPQKPEGEQAEVGRPTLAVLPFENLSGDADSDYFADGVVADIITALSRFRKLAVVSRNSSFVYKGKTVDARAVSETLGAAYLLEGSVRRSGARLRITAQLVEGNSGVTLWTDRFEGDVADVFDFQDRITETVATLVAPAIEASELAQSRQKRPESITTYDILLRAKALIDEETENGNRIAHDLLAEAIVHEPENALILAQMAWSLEHRCAMGWPPISPNDADRCVDFARRGIRHAEGDAWVMAQCALALVQPGRDYSGGMAVIGQAVRQNPNDRYVLTIAGVMQMHCGDLDEAMQLYDRALRMGSTDPIARFALTGLAHLNIVRGDFAVALDFATRSLVLNDRFDATYWMLIAANAHLGRLDQAHIWLKALLEIAPDVSLSRVIAHQPARIPARFEAIAEGLRRAGFPQ